jgi:hypothetical protein
MLADNVELPSDALTAVDALVAKSDGPHFLLATVHFVLNVKPAQQVSTLMSEGSAYAPRPAGSQAAADRPPRKVPRLAAGANDAPFSPAVWKRIREGKIPF